MAWEVEKTEPDTGKWQKVETPSVGAQALDFTTQLGVGALKAAEHFPGAAASLLGKAGEAVGKMGIGDPEVERQRQQFGKENPPFFASDLLPGAKTRAGQYGSSIGGSAVAAAASPGGWLSTIVGALGGGAGAEAGAHLTEGSGGESYASLIGGFLGGFAPTALTRTFNPLPATAHHTANVQALEREGVTDLTAGQRTGYRPLQYAEEHLGGSPTAGQAAQERLDLPRQQYTRAVLTRIGINEDRVTPQIIDRAFTNNGAQFDRLAARNHATIDQNYMRDVHQAGQDYDFLFMDPLRAPVVQNVVEHAVNKLMRGTGTMSGQEYKALRSRLERMRREGKDPETGQFLASVRDAMDNLMERNIQRNNPADLGAWQEVRNQYRNLLVMERVASGPEARGLISPAKLRQSTVATQGKRNYARGRGDFSELARTGESVMPGLPQSGTAPRSLTSSGPLKLVTTGVTGRALMSDPVQTWLSNQGLTGILQQLPTAKAAALRAALSDVLGTADVKRYDERGNPAK